LVSTKAQLGFNMHLFFVVSPTIIVGLLAGPSSSLARFSNTYRGPYLWYEWNLPAHCVSPLMISLIIFQTLIEVAYLLIWCHLVCNYTFHLDKIHPVYLPIILSSCFFFTKLCSLFSCFFSFNLFSISSSLVNVLTQSVSYSLLIGYGLGAFTTHYQGADNIWYVWENNIVNSGHYVSSQSFCKASGQQPHFILLYLLNKMIPSEK
jgi:hypothetical protein